MVVYDARALDLQGSGAWRREAVRGACELSYVWQTHGYVGPKDCYLSLHTINLHDRHSIISHVNNLPYKMNKKLSQMRNYKRDRKKKQNQHRLKSRSIIKHGGLWLSPVDNIVASQLYIS